MDTLRLLAAVWVAVGHGAAFPFSYFIRSVAPNASIPRTLDGIFFNNSAAVIFFFVISGLCIHGPSIAAPRFAVIPFLIRRFIRIGIPLVVILVAISVFGTIMSAAKAVLWTVYCELIYYGLYPLLRIGMNMAGTAQLTIVAFIVALSLALLHPSYLYYWEFGGWAWVIGLPAWLLGCLLAERLHIGRELIPQKVGIAFWRIAGIGISTAALLLLYNLPVKIGYPITLTLFSIYTYFWIKAELIHFSHKSPPRILEWGGQMGYSIYLIHNIAIAAFVGLHPSANPLLLWLCLVTTIFFASYLFYIVIEKPSHRLARELSERLRRSQSATVV